MEDQENPIPIHKMSQKDLLVQYNQAMSDVQLIVNNLAGRIKPQKWTARADETFLCADGFDDAIIGIGNQFANENVLIYSADKIIEIMMERDGMTGEEALEYFEYNIKGAWMGEKTPSFIWETSKEDLGRMQDERIKK